MHSSPLMLAAGRRSEYLLQHTLVLFHTSCPPRLSAPVEQKLRHSVSDCYSLLDVHSDCTEDELRVAYLKKAKVYHPDGQMSTSDADKFVNIQQAYKVALHHKRGQATLTQEAHKKVDINDIKHTVPQHRQYLTFEGIGSGPPSKREQQYRQFKVAQAAESVFEHLIRKHGLSESAVIAKDKAEARKIKISNMIDRVVDDLIRESIQRGDFDNLPGCGKPLDHSDYNPFIDLTTHNINKILVNNGFKPEWIMLSKEIRDGMAAAREKLAVVRETLGPPPYSEQHNVRWKFHTDKFRESVGEINNTITKFNFIVPFMEKQMVHYNVDTNIQRILDNPKQYIHADTKWGSQYVESLSLPGSEEADKKIDWKEVWFNIKQVFTVR